MPALKGVAMSTFKCTLRSRSAAFLLVVVAVLGGCAGVPITQLQSYSDTYDEAKSAAALIYVDAAPALMIGATSSNVDFPASLGPATFDRDGCGAVVASIDSLRARCQAMITLKSYNQALLDIAAGKTSDDILAQVDRAFDSVSTLSALAQGGAAALAPVANALPALKAILGEALKLRDRAALRSALEQGAPQIRNLVQYLRGDVDLMYRLQRAYAVKRLNKLQSAIDADVSGAMRVIATSAPPKDPAAAASLKLLEQRFEDLFSTPEPSVGARLKGLRPDPSGKALDGPAVASVEAQLGVATGHVAEFKAAAAQFGKSADALAHYDALLAAVDKSLTELLVRSNQPFAAGGGADQLVQSIVTVRDKARDIKQLLASR
jgi:hypothetical protein